MTQGEDPMPKTLFKVDLTKPMDQIVALATVLASLLEIGFCAFKV
jgi:hypothetical protein